MKASISSSTSNFASLFIIHYSILFVCFIGFYCMHLILKLLLDIRGTLEKRMKYLSTNVELFLKVQIHGDINLKTSYDGHRRQP
jgi:hypothetical protein